MSASVRSGHQPDRFSDADLVIEALDRAEFMALLRKILTHSGRTAGKAAAYAGLPRSTAYHFVSKANTRLPRDRDQVAAFVGACRLSDGQVARVLALWDRLTASAADVVVEGELVEEGGRAVEKVRVHTTDARVVEPVITTNLNAVLPSSFVVNGGTVHLTSTHNTTMTEQHGGLEEGPCEAHELRSLRIRRLRFQILLLTPLTLATTVAVGTSFHEPALIALATTMLLFLAHEEVRKLNRDRR